MELKKLKLRRPWFALPLAAMLMAAAPPNMQTAPAPSPWSRVVAATKRFLHDPLGRSAAPRNLTVDPEMMRMDRNRAGSAFGDPAESDQAAGVAPRKDFQVQQATASEQMPPADAAQHAQAQRQPKKQRPSLFSRSRQPSRTVSEFMAEEKP